MNGARLPWHRAPPTPGPARVAQDFKKLEKRRQKEEKLALMGMEQHLARIVVQQEEDKPVLMRPDRGTAGPRVRGQRA